MWKKNLGQILEQFRRKFLKETAGGIPRQNSEKIQNNRWMDWFLDKFFFELLEDEQFLENNAEEICGKILEVISEKKYWRNSWRNFWKNSWMNLWKKKLPEKFLKKSLKYFFKGIHKKIVLELPNKFVVDFQDFLKKN